jgi:hypothetical protein
MASSISALTSKLVTSSDGALIYAEAAGDSSRPAIMFVPGLTMSGIVFEKQCEDEKLLQSFYLVSNSNSDIEA